MAISKKLYLVLPIFLISACNYLGHGHGKLKSEELQLSLNQRFDQDRTGACLAAGLIQDGQIFETSFCSQASSQREINADTVFEIGSISKPMLGVLLAQEHERGRLDPDSNLAAYLPEMYQTPQASLLSIRRLLTHTSGLPALPPRMIVVQADDPYSSLTVDQVLSSLQDIALSDLQSSGFSYSNFGAMLMSWLVTHQTGQDLDELFRSRLFEPLGMTATTLNGKTTQGHYSYGQVSPNWNIPTNLAGVGGVRSTVRDMLSFANAYLEGNNVIPEVSTEVLIDLFPGTKAGWFWHIMEIGDTRILAHEGATGGFSSLIAIDLTNRRAIVILSDTSLVNLGGLGTVGLHMLGLHGDPGRPRIEVQPDPKLIEALVGEYELQTGLRITLSEVKGYLAAQAEGQGQFLLAYDSYGDFFPREFDALMTPQLIGDTYQFIWFQGGAALVARRIDDQ